MMSLLALLCTLAYPTVQSEQFSKEVQHKALAATVRIVLPERQGEGTGVIVSRRDKMVFILTSNHVVAKGPAAEVQTFSDSSYPKPNESTSADVWLRWPDDDLALMRAVLQAPPEPLRICPVTDAPKRDNFSVLTVGCSNGAEPTCMVDQLLRSGQFVKPNGSKAQLWQAATPSTGGRSGGPLIDHRGYVVGICSGSANSKDGRKEGFYTHLTVIHTALEKEGVSWLYTDPPKDAK
jgi:S1-C subfamily serine protease